MVSFTGSTRASKRVSELASATVKRVALEDADLAAAVKGMVNACFLNSGQTLLGAHAPVGAREQVR
jgi:aldehyde dehydrogenase (NAD+)